MIGLIEFNGCPALWASLLNRKPHQPPSQEDMKMILYFCLSMISLLLIIKTRSDFVMNQSSFSPHWLQKPDPGRFSLPHFGQYFGSGFSSAGCPHLGQNLALGGRFLPQFWHWP
jgi:hypothetical protein